MTLDKFIGGHVCCNTDGSGSSLPSTSLSFFYAHNNSWFLHAIVQKADCQSTNLLLHLNLHNYLQSQ